MSRWDRLTGRSCLLGRTSTCEKETADQNIVPAWVDSGDGGVDAAECAGLKASLCLGHFDFGIGQGVRDFIPARLVRR